MIGRLHRGKRSKPSKEQRNQRLALRYFISITAQRDKIKKELINLCDEQDNYWFLDTTFGCYDYAVPASYAFSGCVLRTNKGDGAWDTLITIPKVTICDESPL